MDLAMAASKNFHEVIGRPDRLARAVTTGTTSNSQEAPSRLQAARRVEVVSRSGVFDQSRR